MIIIETKEFAGVNPFYPLLTPKRRRIRVVRWDRYHRNLRLFSLTGLILCCYGIAMLVPGLYSDRRFELLALFNLCFTLARFVNIRTGTNVYIFQAVSIHRSPLLADLEFALAYAALGVASLVVVIGGFGDYVELTAIFGSVSFLLAGLPFINNIAVRFGFGTLS